MLMALSGAPELPCYSHITRKHYPSRLSYKNMGSLRAGTVSVLFIAVTRGYLVVFAEYYCLG